MIEDFNQPTHKFDFVPGVLRLHAAAVISPGGGQSRKLVVTSDKDGPNSVFERELPDAEIVISHYPRYW